jgi:hypothetical protein
LAKKLLAKGGVGIYHRYQEFTQPTVAYATGFDPFFGLFAFTANQVLASYSVNKPGIRLSIGPQFNKLQHYSVGA